MSIRVKTIIGIACIEAVLLALLVMMTLDYLRTSNYDSFIKHASTTSALFAATTKDAVLSYDLASLESFVNEVLIHRDLLYARVLGPDGNVFAQAGQSEYLEQAFVADHHVESVSDDVFDTFSEISEEGVIYGRVEIGLDTSNLTTIITEAENRSAVIAVIEMGLVALFSFLLGGYLTRQLKILSIAAKSITEGDLEINIPIKGRDEIANVAIAFNVMASSLKEASTRRDQYEAELQKLNRSLEGRVFSRSEQIQAKNIELEKANQNIKEAQLKLLHSEKMSSIGLLAAGVAHEINNPVGYVMSNLHSLKHYVQSYRSLIDEYMLLTTLTDADKRQAQQLKIDQLCQQYDLDFMNEDLDFLIQESIEGTVRVSNIVKSLKEFSHIDTMNSYIMCNLNDCIKSALNMANNELKYHCDIQKDLADLPLTYCCSGQISQIVLNLIINAGHAIEGHGSIYVRSRQDEKMLEISVSDTGKGIPENQIHKLFDPFFTTKAVGEGTGLGLSIAYGIAKEHGGEILVESKVGKGSCFSLRIPLVTEE
ncbi:sensor histidine kinase [Neptunomonas antarctica]|uniref:histidine kinase n=1 Tax=Neptunomonas antarctica TaxID=619304 RepID=A0A1N7NN95_9GAMM|nr:ATP-binding protein [Neptunomonas antarctica]SIS99740.1 His Kinase A (phospho-acceptor) domain-containing protein [Neptunomonas antarctica]